MKVFLIVALAAALSASSSSSKGSTTLPSALPLPDTSHRVEASPQLPSKTQMADCKATPSRTLSRLPLQTPTPSVSLDSSRTATSSRGMLHQPQPVPDWFLPAELLRLPHTKSFQQNSNAQSANSFFQSGSSQFGSDNRFQTNANQINSGSRFQSANQQDNSFQTFDNQRNSAPHSPHSTTNRTLVGFQSGFNQQDSNNQFQSSFKTRFQHDSNPLQQPRFQQIPVHLQQPSNNQFQQNSNNRFQSNFNNQDSNRFSQNSQTTSFLQSSSDSVSGVFEPLNLPSGASALLGGITSAFSCLDRPYGYYADQDNSCRVFHVCNPTLFSNGAVETYQYSFMCGEGSVFDQKELTLCGRVVRHPLPGILQLLLHQRAVWTPRR
ncbi:hypothetical protein C7M84_013156 [Penaeus vannamei]|uniref:Uncharacterized protein n=1 Tax=Penaeus vannamei TaxID=6689 RepID=A0A3R7M0W0_PENVA|nr:hypothetical protein C7M84_013156 [Penaeus vannamei]